MLVTVILFRCFVNLSLNCERVRVVSVYLIAYYYREIKFGSPAEF